MSATENRYVNVYVNGKEVLGTYSQMQKRASQLRGEINRGKLTQEELNQKMKEYNVLQSKMKEHRAMLRGNNNELKKTNTAWSRLKTTMLGVAGGLGIARGFQLIGRAIRNAAQTVVEFDQKNADLRAVLQATKEETKSMREQQVLLGSTSAFTASQVAELQIELAKLGNSKTEIQAMTPAILNLAAAAGTDLKNAAEIAGSTLKAFELDATESQRVVDVMSKSFSSSALDIEKFKVAMRTAGPVARNAGLSIEQATAQLALLVDRGIRAESAGTALRNIFLKLAKDGRTYEEAMLDINTATDKNKAAVEAFGMEAAVQAIILAENADAADELTSALNSAGGAAEQMANEKLDTLSGDTIKLTSAWEGLILSIENGEGVFGKAARFLTQLTTKVVGLISELSKRPGEMLGTLIEAFYPNSKQAIASDIALSGLEKMKNQINNMVQDQNLTKLKEYIEDLKEMQGNVVKGGVAYDRLRTEIEKAEEAQRSIADSLISSSLGVQEEKVQQSITTLGDLKAELQALKNELDNVSSAEGFDAISEQIKAKEAEIAAIDGSNPDEKEDKKLEKEQQKYEKLLALIEAEEAKVNIAKLEGLDQELAKLDEHYDKLAEKAEGHTEELIRIEELREQAKDQVRAEYELKRQEAEAQIGDFLTAETADPNQAEIDQLSAKYDQMIEMAEEFGLETVELEEARNAAITAIQKKQAEEQTQTELAKFRAIVNVYDRAASDILGGMMDLSRGIGDESKRSAEFQKKLALLQIGVSTGTAIAIAIAESMKLGFPAAIPAVATAIGAILSFMGQARAASQEQEVPEYAMGTMNASGSFIAGDQGREVVNPASVIPANITQDILAANTFRASLPQPNFSMINDGLTFTQSQQQGQSSLGGGGGGSMDIKGLENIMLRIENAVNKQGSKPVIFSERDWQEFRERKDGGEARVSFRG